jgi:hypothetical protein
MAEFYGYLKGHAKAVSRTGTIHSGMASRLHDKRWTMYSEIFGDRRIYAALSHPNDVTRRVVFYQGSPENVSHMELARFQLSKLAPHERLQLLEEAVKEELLRG